MVKEKDKQILIYYIFLQYIKQLYIAQLLSANDDSYTYDSRGNITSKTVNDETVSFTYANTGWKDLLVSVDDTELEYDANGNVILYGDREFTWTYGRSLASVLDGMDEYTYTYDENGIRTSKTVDDVTTYYNTKDGVILSQTDGTDTIYFQYDNNGAPLGFVWNGTQYLYLTNQMGDVISITDTSGTVVANYEYDAWGKVLTADTNIAKQNPLRYRGYYYDNETGYYYLQSRYYDSNICRFINADIPEISQMAKDVPVGTNLFAYCNNNPVNNRDATGEIPLIASLVIGAIVGIVLLYVVDVISNLIRKRNMWKRVSSYSDYVSAAISGALSMVSIKKFSSLITASISSITYICNCIESGRKFDFLSLVVIILIDLAFGILAGKGVNLTSKVGIIKTSNNKLKTLVSPKKIAQYKNKIKSAKRDIIKRSIRNAFATVTSKLQEKIRAHFGNKIKNKFIKRLVSAGV